MERPSKTLAAPTSKLTLVAAGSFDQFISWCAENQIHPKHFSVKYVRDPQDLRGFNSQGARLVKYGTWYMKKELVPFIEDFEAMADIPNPTVHP